VSGSLREERSTATFVDAASSTARVRSQLVQDGRW
jgi:hypothetical protein